MGAKVQKGTRIKLKFSDGASIEWSPVQALDLDYVLGEIQRLAEAFEPTSPDSGANS